MTTGERPQRNCTLKRASRTRSITHFPKTLTGCTGGFGIAYSDGKAALGGQERREGPAIKQLALPTVLASEKRRPVTPATGKDVLQIEDLWSITGPRIPDVQPLIRAVVLRNLSSAQRLTPGKVGDRRKTMPVVHLQGHEQRVVVRVAGAGGRIDCCRLRAEHGAAKRPGTQSTVRTRPARRVRVKVSPEVRNSGRANEPTHARLIEQRLGTIGEAGTVG